MAVLGLWAIAGEFAGVRDSIDVEAIVGFANVLFGDGEVVGFQEGSEEVAH